MGLKLYKIQKEIENREELLLNEFAQKSKNAWGLNDKLEKNEDFDIGSRNRFQRDRDRILHTNAFRRLIHKTQVFTVEKSDHLRTRLTHTLEVVQISRSIARVLGLNEDLAEAIALGHDIGHTPFGHAGERALNGICTEGFEHNVQSIRVVELLENHGEGLNLSKEVRDGILNHQTKGMPSTLEGKIVRLSDKIAYINHDIDDAIRGHIITEEDIPKEYSDILGHNPKERLNTLIHDIISQSEDKKDISMSSEIENAMFGMRKYMFQSVYTNPIAKGEEQRAMAMLEQLFLHYKKNLELLPEEYQIMIEQKGETATRVICDYIAGMTDAYAIKQYGILYGLENINE
jgi:dGTPase